VSAAVQSLTGELSTRTGERDQLQAREAELARELASTREQLRAETRRAPATVTGLGLTPTPRRLTPPGSTRPRPTLAGSSRRVSCRFPAAPATHLAQNPGALAPQPSYFLGPSGSQLT